MTLEYFLLALFVTASGRNGGWDSGGVDGILFSLFSRLHGVYGRYPGGMMHLRFTGFHGVEKEDFWGGGVELVSFPLFTDPRGLGQENLGDMSKLVFKAYYLLWR